MLKQGVYGVRGYMDGAAPDVVHFPDTIPPILDQTGAPLPQIRGTGWMVKLDARGAEEVTLRKSTLWFIGVLLVAIPLLATAAYFFIVYGREDQAVKSDIQAVRSKQDEMEKAQKVQEAKIDKLTQMMVDGQIRDAKNEGIKLGVMAAEEPKK